MEAITEDYVSFDTAKLLKEKGFKGQRENFYENNKIISYINYWDRITPKQRYEAIEAPTLQMAMKWLREVHGLFISIGNDDLDYNWQIFDIKNRTKDLDPTCLTESYAGYRKYEEACEAAIKYCLEKLI